MPMVAARRPGVEYALHCVVVTFVTSSDDGGHGQQIIVRTNSGVLVSVTQAANPGLRVHQRVYIEGSGEGARVMAQ